MLENALKMTQDGSKMAQNRLKKRSSSKMRDDDEDNKEKRENMHFVSTGAQFLRFFEVPGEHLGPSWGHLGPSWRHLRPLSTHLDSKMTPG